MHRIPFLSPPALNTFFTCLFICTSIILLAQCNSKPPKQNSTNYNQRGFPTFVDSLTHAIQTNDTAFIFSHVDTGMVNGFGYNSGKEAFKRLWNEPKASIDDELLTALSLGTAYDSTTQKVYAPYHFVTFPDSLDAFSYAYILRDDAPAYHQPDSTTSPKQTLSKKWIEVTSWSATNDDTTQNGDPVWADIKLGNGETAVMQRRYLRSPIDYRFWFEKKNGRWFLMGWAGGD